MYKKIIEFLKDKNIAIVGYGKEGKSTYNFIRKYLEKQKITILDGNENLAINNKELESDENVFLVVGDNYLNNLEKYDLIIKSPGVKFKNLDIPFLYCNNKSTSNTDIINKIKLEALDSTKVSEILRIINENFYPSKYSVKNEGHQGLGLSSYCHVTNPIRNYSSLVIQRLEQDFLFTDRIDDRLIYAWEDYLEDLVIELNEKKDKYRSYNFRYYKFYNKNNK